MVDDGSDLVEDNQVSKDCAFLGVFDGDTMAAAFMIRPKNTICYEIHGGLAPEYWGRGPTICRDMAIDLFKMTPCLKLVAEIPEFNRLMRNCVQDAGMSFEGIIKKAFMKNMKLHDLYVYGVSRQEGIKCQPPQH